MGASEVGRAIRCLPEMKFAGAGGCGMHSDEGSKDSDAAKLAKRGLGGTCGGLEGVACTDEWR